MNEHIVTLSKRRSQLKQAITKMVQEAYELVEKTPDLDTKLKLIETLRTVTTGKVRTIEKNKIFFSMNYFEDFC
jgi:26S proteasome regulatory subunit N5